MKERYNRSLIIDGKGTIRDIKPLEPEVNIPKENILVTDKKEISISWRNNFTRMAEIAKSWKEVFPYQDEINVNLNNLAEYPDKPYLIYWGSDWHVGNVDTNYQKLREHIDLIENTPNTGIITLGDYIDNGILGRMEVRFMQTSSPYVQAFTLQDLMAELSGRNPRNRQIILAHCIGNHTHTLMEQAGMLYEKFYDKSKAGILPGIGKVNVTLGEQKYEIALAHKFIGSSKLNRTLAPKRLMEYGYPNADIAVVGHMHNVAYEKFFKGGKWHVAQRPGTYRCGTDLFELARGWGHGELGGSGVIIYPDTLDVFPFNELEKGIKFLQMELQN